MLGDKFRVFYTTGGGGGGGGTESAGVFDSWTVAKDARDATFNDNVRIRACWIMRDNPGLGLQPDKRGYTLRRNKYEVTQ